MVGLTACSDSLTSPVPKPGPGVAVLTIDTFDGSGQAVHPDFAATPAGWGNSESHLALTPYPGGNASFENPSFYDGFSLLDWRVPSGARNPIETPPAGAYLSDPDQIYDPESGELWLYYREVTSENVILLTRSAGGVHWSAPQVMFSVPDHLAVSPSVVHRGPGDWLMWSVNSGSAGCSSFSTTVELRRSADGLHWSSPETLALTGPDGTFAWHIDVEWIAARNEFWALFNAKTPGSCTTSTLYFATSTDGITWNVAPSPALRAGAIPEFSDVVYRSSVAFDAATHTVTLWYSGARLVGSGYHWRVATETLSEAAFLTRVTSRVNLGQAPAAPAVELTNETAP